MPSEPVAQEPEQPQGWGSWALGLPGKAISGVSGYATKKYKNYTGQTAAEREAAANAALVAETDAYLAARQQRWEQDAIQRNKEHEEAEERARERREEDARRPVNLIAKHGERQSKLKTEEEHRLYDEYMRLPQKGYGRGGKRKTRARKTRARKTRRRN